MNTLLDKAVSEIKRRNMNVYSVTVVSQGKSETVRIKDDSNCRDVYSVSKAFTMAAIGFLFDECKITPQETVADIFGKLPCGADERWADVTVHDALRHRTGMLSGNVDIDSEDILKIKESDWLDYLFCLPLEGKRGEDYHYTDAAYYLLSRIVSKKCEMTLFDYLREKLFNPLRFREAAWSTCPKGYSMGGSGLFITCEDMAKLGKLWLDAGAYNGEQLISKEWVDLAVQNEYAFSPRYDGCYYKTGMRGQIVYFSYPEDFVLAIQSYVPSGEMSELIDFLL